MKFGSFCKFLAILVALLCSATKIFLLLLKKLKWIVYLPQYKKRKLYNVSKTDS